ncbi:MAG: SRPBCC family protein [Bacteroidota bacterium]|nr:SRPBCC family protein [Bacteroidota bacterium]
MEQTNNKSIIVEVTIKDPISKVWKCWTSPEHIVKWNNASEDWHSPHSENDLRIGGKFLTRMEAKDKNFGFDFWGIYDEIREEEFIAYTLGDGRKVSIQFSGSGNETKVTETFEMENENSEELQRGGWQAILNNFKTYVES